MKGLLWIGIWFMGLHDAWGQLADSSAVVPIGVLTDSLSLPPDTLPQPVVQPPRPKVSVTANLDFRDSFLYRRHVNIWGANAGIVFGEKRHQLTIGYYWLTYDTYLRLIDWHKDAARRLNLDYYLKTDMYFISTMYWWNLIHNKRWTLTIPLEIGAGLATTIPFDTLRERPINPGRRDFFLPVQAGIYGEWKAHRWIGFGAQLGYRLSLLETNLKQHYDGVYYSVGVVFYPALLTDTWDWLRGKKSLKAIWRSTL